MKFLANIIISALAVIISSYLLPGVQVDSFLTSLLVALVLAFLNAIVKPLLTILTIPITLITMGLFLAVINALMILWAAKLVDGFQVKGFWWAILFSFILTLISSLLNGLFGNKNESQNDQFN
ncbi:MAG: phage holin family protein [Bacteroidia bacterium]